MPRAKSQKDIGTSGFKIRIVVDGNIIHVLSSTEPVVHLADAERISRLEWTPVLGTEHGDTIGFIRWSAVSAVSWRFSGED